MNDKNSQEAPQQSDETFTGKGCDYAKTGTASPGLDAETRAPTTQNDKG